MLIDFAFLAEFFLSAYYFSNWDFNAHCQGVFAITVGPVHNCK